MGINAEHMGTSLDLGVSGVHCTMRAVVFVLLGAVAINAEAEADPVLVHHTGVGHTVAGVYNAHVPGVHHVAGVHPAYPGVYSHPYHLNVMYGKREAEPEADPLVYTNGVVHHTGIHHVAGVYNAHVPAVHAGVTHVAGVHPVHTVAPAVNHVAGVYSHPYHYNVMYGKREADAEAEPYTMGQVYVGLPVANAIATGSPHNVGVITNMVSPVHHSVHHPYMGFGFYG